MIAWFADASMLLSTQDADDPDHLAALRIVHGVAPIATLDLAFYEASNVATRAWRNPEAARRLRAMITELAADDRLVRADPVLIEDATGIAERHGISVYDAAYVAGARAIGAQLVSCDIRDLVSRDLAVTPRQACERL